MAMSVNSVVANYTFNYKSEMRPILDRNADGNWSKEEVTNYAADFKAATSESIDVDAVFKKYDVNNDNSLEFSEYEKATADDAFGMSVLSKKHAESSSVLGNQSQLGSVLNEKPVPETDAANSTVANTSEWLQSLDNSTRHSLVTTTVWADNMSSMLNSMLSTNNMFNSSNFAISQYTSISNYAKAAYTVSTLDMSV